MAGHGLKRYRVIVLYLKEAKVLDKSGVTPADAVGQIVSDDTFTWPPDKCVWYINGYLVRVQRTDENTFTVIEGGEPD